MHVKLGLDFVAVTAKYDDDDDYDDDRLFYSIVLGCSFARVCVASRRCIIFKMRNTLRGHGQTLTTSPAGGANTC